MASDIGSFNLLAGPPAPARCSWKVSAHFNAVRTTAARQCLYRSSGGCRGRNGSVKPVRLVCWVLGKHDLDAMLAERDKLNADIQDVLDKQTEAWGIKVSTVEIKRIDLNESMIRAIARQAEAERTRRAKIINAEGEQQAAQKLLDAARILAPVPQAMQLRYLATLFDIAGERSSTIMFPMPIDLMKTWAGQAPAEGS